MLFQKQRQNSQTSMNRFSELESLRNHLAEYYLASEGFPLGSQYLDLSPALTSTTFSANLIVGKPGGCDLIQISPITTEIPASVPFLSSQKMRTRQ